MKKPSLILTVLLMTFTMASAQENKEIINTTCGPVSGIIQEGTMAWLGIPYAKVERFMPPQPVKKWKSVRKCDKWGPMTMQQQSRPMTEEQMSENCCVLNVWTTDVKAKKPVIRMGSGHVPRQKGCSCSEHQPPSQHPRFPRSLHLW